MALHPQEQRLEAVGPPDRALFARGVLQFIYGTGVSARLDMLRPTESWCHSLQTKQLTSQLINKTMARGPGIDKSKPGCFFCFSSLPCGKPRIERNSAASRRSRVILMPVFHDVCGPTGLPVRQPGIRVRDVSARARGPFTCDPERQTLHTRAWETGRRCLRTNGRESPGRAKVQSPLNSEHRSSRKQAASSHPSLRGKLRNTAACGEFLRTSGRRRLSDGHSFPPAQG